MQTRKTYTEEFRREAAMQVIENGYKVAEVAQRLGISSKSLYHWVDKYRKPEHVRLNESADAAELRKLKAELKRVTEERDILKKATAFFAKLSD